MFSRSFEKSRQQKDRVIISKKTFKKFDEGSIILYIKLQLHQRVNKKIVFINFSIISSNLNIKLMTNKTYKINKKKI